MRVVRENTTEAVYVNNHWVAASHVYLLAFAFRGSTVVFDTCVFVFIVTLLLRILPEWSILPSHIFYVVKAILGGI